MTSTISLGCRVLGTSRKAGLGIMRVIGSAPSSVLMIEASCRLGRSNSGPCSQIEKLFASCAGRHEKGRRQRAAQGQAAVVEITQDGWQLSPPEETSRQN